jgi:predicted transcriptional regulator
LGKITSFVSTTTSKGIYFFPKLISSKSKQRKIPLYSAQKGRTEIESERTYNQLADERKYAIQACIVRIMKARKKLTHQQLIVSVIDQIKHRFRPNMTEIKVNIEALIEREYIERDKDINVYKYVS